MDVEQRDPESDERDIKIDAETPEEGGDTEIAEDENRADAKVKKIRAGLEACKKEKQEYLDGWQRAKADYVNALKRFEGDVTHAKADGVVKAVEALLPAYDALERAKDLPAGRQGMEQWPQGFVAIAKQLEAAFAGLGLEAVGQIGDRFNPVLHEALGQDSIGSVDQDDTITAVLEKGYRMSDHVIRPAKVRVAHFGN
ncbi:MAG: nucleotide exchange factor GrpE [bacterium]|nr:nucleotide exchange factor GrpE [bacterium]